MTEASNGGDDAVAVAASLPGMDVAERDMPSVESNHLLAEIRAECLRRTQGDVVLALDVACGLALTSLDATSYGFARGQIDFTGLMRKMQHTD